MPLTLNERILPPARSYLLFNGALARDSNLLVDDSSCFNAPIEVHPQPSGYFNSLINSQHERSATTRPKPLVQ